MITPAQRSAARGLLRSLGWRASGVRPECKKSVVLAAPHTSNWDGVLLLAFAWHFELQIQWMVKSSVVESATLGPVVRRLGAVSVNRSASQDLVAAMVRAFEERESLHLVVSPPGTRSRREHWKSGFYWIARRAAVPVVCSFLDYERRVGGFGPTLELTGNMRADMDELREFYGPIRGRHPERMTPIRLAEEPESTD